MARVCAVEDDMALFVIGGGAFVFLLLLDSVSVVVAVLVGFATGFLIWGAWAAYTHMQKSRTKEKKKKGG